MKININRLFTIPRYHFVIGGLVIIVRQPSVARLGYDNYVKLIVPQRFINDGSRLKGIGREWFTPARSLGDPHK